MRKYFNLLKRSYVEAKRDRIQDLSASLSYYVIFTIAPLLYIALVIGGLIYEEGEIETAVHGYLLGTVGSQSADFVRGILEQIRNLNEGVWLTLFVAVFLIFGASNFYGFLRRSFDQIQSRRVRREKPDIRLFIRKRVLSVVFLIVISMIFAVLVLVNLSLSVFRDIVLLLPFGSLSGLVVQALNFAFTFFGIFLIFSAMYRILSGFVIPWRNAAIGASVSAVLFIVVNTILGLYFKNSHIATFYGVGGSVILTLIWLYYSSQIFFFGAEVMSVSEEEI
ncbi:MAG: hypothetical protein A3G52_02170 [Candidatus Taylorbacteria bacterium RIFCSPLOWO2_12_FULL_43_20]|uniref:Uncharacterized protein n=1 Tax=Candidatus Taylorbacteria bacterium RIFCSPLOWO2_12_FULL_43_20 TaxID=1802332 RepID=A0A1G2P555_9BACT|nr:MAG: hypothetical protein A2825_01055 [Candidatus Taylorbacteria bacterium RIFCSPHIGHO2_01_FULL_43_120]OHA23584.1 MAG: hypothetical protein A3B98_00500 [Candidatus Taylorbacteria bacterium RIFCSPHIGHO2_02_FULL_43_55]OHA28881.1 MAG: hypothetical protein A3E92_04375 [Candidatus Taylorbacteria bacterium RIFCSPHIGHO2_12_FULL_42_34]OHA30289.1 MAG: hypothetical protein A3B09_03970 [Candidatus Taylorbacteria bacterium RIFCSPLOWO2_01_FULL_43_83]OHA39341.1 MAG: hypothetical protein A3H58_04135 [Candi